MHPILFQSSMVRAILRETDPKTQTRRIADMDAHRPKPCKYGNISDHLWVKETFFDATRFMETPFFAGRPSPICYRADLKDDFSNWQTHDIGCHYWKPSIFMSQAHSRITLEITNLRVQRLQDITETDAMAEGVPWKDYAGLASKTARKLYRHLWNSINLKPKPIYQRNEQGEKQIVAYESYPWSIQDFRSTYPKNPEAKLHRGKPLHITPNPFVWAITFKRIKP